MKKKIKEQLILAIIGIAFIGVLIIAPAIAEWLASIISNKVIEICLYLTPGLILIAFLKGDK